MLGVNWSWREYFLAFQEQHGEPIQEGKLLLFADGWTYSAFSHRGPETPPPADPLALADLKRRYWRGRLALVRKLIVFHAQRLRKLEPLSAANGY